MFVRSFIYDSLGHLVQLDYLGYTHKGTRVKYKYDQQGKEIEAETEGAGPDNDGKWISTYTSDTLITQREWYNSKGQLDTKYNYVYDQHANLLDAVGRVYPDNRLFHREVSRYDSTNILIQQDVYSFSKIGEPERVDRSDFEYYR